VPPAPAAAPEPLKRRSRAGNGADSFSARFKSDDLGALGDSAAEPAAATPSSRQQPVPRQQPVSAPAPQGAPTQAPPATPVQEQDTRSFLDAARESLFQEFLRWQERRSSFW